MNQSPSIKARRDLPPGYSLFWRIDIKESKTALRLSIWGTLLLLVSWFGFLAIARALKPDVLPIGFYFKMETLGEALVFLGELILVTALMLILHEGLHGVFFRLITHERPKYGLKIYYASAAAPDWYIPRRLYFLTALAPLLGITPLCLAALAWLPQTFAMPALLLLVFNTSGAIGDIWVVAKLISSPRDTLVKDYGDIVAFYTPK
jgi:hypothetical protein